MTQSRNSFPSATSLLAWAGKHSILQSLHEGDNVVYIYNEHDKLYHYFACTGKDYSKICTSGRDLGEMK